LRASAPQAEARAGYARYVARFRDFEFVLWLLVLLLRVLRELGSLLPASTASPSFPSVLRQPNLPFLRPRHRNCSPTTGGAIATVKLVQFLYVPLLG
jgi:hypothetical protein